MAGTEVVRKRGRLSAGNYESSGLQADSYAETQAGKGRRMQIPDLIRTVGGVVVLKKGCQCGWLPESFPETGMRAVFVISQAPDSAYVRIE